MKTKIQYSENRRREDRASSYNTKYEREFHKRVSNRREKALLGRILDTTLVAGERHERLLDVPSGAGRLSGVLSNYATKVYEVDYSHEILKFCRRNAAGHGYSPRLANATVFKLPFGDASFDLVASVRLSHHIPEFEDRLVHVRELCRVSRNYVLVTFFGEESVKNRLRNLRRALGSKKRSKHTLHHDQLRSAASERGFDLLRSWSLAPFFSGHYYALLKKRQ